MTDVNKTSALKITRLGPSVAAPEWALREGMDIADWFAGDCSDDAAWQRRAELAKEIAEALYAVAVPMYGGAGPSCDACNGSGRAPMVRKGNAGV